MAPASIKPFPAQKLYGHDIPPVGGDTCFTSLEQAWRALSPGMQKLLSGLTGETLREDTDPHWTDIIAGVPAELGNGSGESGPSIVWTEISEDTRRLVVAPAGELASATAVTPAGLQVRQILGTDGDDVLFTASTEPTETGVWRYGPGGRQCDAYPHEREVEPEPAE